MILILNLPTAGASNRFIDYQGFSVFHGRSDGTSIGPDTVDAYEWTTFNYTLGKNLTTWAAFETLLGAGHLETEHYGDTETLEVRVLTEVHYKFLFLKFGAGIAHLFDDSNLPGPLSQLGWRHGMDIVDGKQAGNSILPCHGRDQACHPVVAVDNVRFYPGDDINDDISVNRFAINSCSMTKAYHCKDYFVIPPYGTI